MLIIFRSKWYEPSLSPHLTNSVQYIMSVLSPPSGRPFNRLTRFNRQIHPRVQFFTNGSEIGNDESSLSQATLELRTAGAPGSCVSSTNICRRLQLVLSVLTVDKARKLDPMPLTVHVLTSLASCDCFAKRLQSFTIGMFGSIDT